MTNPNPPGWHPDPAGSGKQRWWDGENWTESYSDAQPGSTVGGLGAAGPPPPPQKRPMSQGTKIAIGVGAAVVAIVLVAAIAGGAEDSDSTDTAATSSTPTPTPTPNSATSTVPPVVTSSAAAPVPTTSTAASPAPARTTTPRPVGCQDAPPEYLDVINASFLNGYQLTDVSAFSVGETWYVAGEITQDGDVRSRDDLFAAKDMVITPVTATARTESTLPDLRRVLDVSFTDDGATKALDCARTY